MRISTPSFSKSVTGFYWHDLAAHQQRSSRADNELFREFIGQKAPPGKQEYLSNGCPEEERLSCTIVGGCPEDCASLQCRVTISLAFRSEKHKVARHSTSDSRMASARKTERSRRSIRCKFYAIHVNCGPSGPASWSQDEERHRLDSSLPVTTIRIFHEFPR